MLLLNKQDEQLRYGLHPKDS